MKKGVLRNFTKFTGNTWTRVSFLIKLQASEHLVATASLMVEGLCSLLFKREWY